MSVTAGTLAVSGRHQQLMGSHWQRCQQVGVTDVVQQTALATLQLTVNASRRDDTPICSHCCNCRICFEYSVLSTLPFVVHSRQGNYVFILFHFISSVRNRQVGYFWGSLILTRSAPMHGVEGSGLWTHSGPTQPHCNVFNAVLKFVLKYIFVFYILCFCSTFAPWR